LWKWIIIPGIFYAMLFTISMYFFGKSATAVISYLTIDTGLQSWLDKLESSWIGFFFTVASVILWLILMLLYFSLFKYIWLIIGSPVFSFLSEKTASIIEGKNIAFNFRQYLIDVERGVRMAVRNTLWQTVYVLSIMFLSLLPFVGWATPLLAIIIECYYYGFSMLDYSCERNKMSAGKSIDFIGHHKGLAIGNGIVFYLMHFVVGIGWIFAPAYAVIAATISMHQIKQKESAIR
jgi:CysZ protein